MKFMNRQKFLATLNQWVRDGSEIVEIVTDYLGEEVTLRGKDGATEYLTLYYLAEDYRKNTTEVEGDDNQAAEYAVIDRYIDGGSL
jgi:hypothetical protein